VKPSPGQLHHPPLGLDLRLTSVLHSEQCILLGPTEEKLLQKQHKCINVECEYINYGVVFSVLWQMLSSSTLAST